MTKGITVIFRSPIQDKWDELRALLEDVSKRADNITPPDKVRKSLYLSGQGLWDSPIIFPENYTSIGAETLIIILRQLSDLLTDYQRNYDSHFGSRTMLESILKIHTLWASFQRIAEENKIDDVGGLESHANLDYRVYYHKRFTQVASNISTIHGPEFRNGCAAINQLCTNRLPLVTDWLYKNLMTRLATSMLLLDRGLMKSIYADIVTLLFSAPKPTSEDANSLERQITPIAEWILKGLNFLDTDEVNTHKPRLSPVYQLIADIVVRRKVVIWALPLTEIVSLGEALESIRDGMRKYHDTSDVSCLKEVTFASNKYAYETKPRSTGDVYISSALLTLYDIHNGQKAEPTA